MVINGNSDADTFTVAPSATAPITVNGLAPTTVPGDVLTVDLLNQVWGPHCG